MFKFLKSLRGFSSAARPTKPGRRPRSFRPQLEDLEGRQLLSGTSLISAISYNSYNPITNTVQNHHALFAIDRTKQQVVEYVDQTRYALGGPKVTDVSASIDQSFSIFGHRPEVFALNTSGLLWRWAPSTGWLQLGGPTQFAEISATRDGQVYADTYLIHNTTSVDLIDATGKTYYLGANFYDVSAGRDASGRDEVFALGFDNHIYVNDAGTPTGWQLVDGSRQFYRISATQHGEVYALDTTGNLFQESLVTASVYMLVQPVSLTYWSATQYAQGPFYSISADSADSTHDEVYTLDLSGNAYRIGPQGGAVRVATGVSEIAGADGGWFYEVGSWGGIPGQVREVSPSGQYWNLSGSVL
jgi:hypothetical protein